MKFRVKKSTPLNKEIKINSISLCTTSTDTTPIWEQRWPLVAMTKIQIRRVRVQQLGSSCIKLELSGVLSLLLVSMFRNISMLLTRIKMYTCKHSGLVLLILKR